MNHDDQERACQYVLDQLSAAERSAFAERLRAEPELANLVRALERTLEARVAALPQRKPAPEVWDRIEAELAGQSGADGGLKHRPTVGRNAFFGRWALLGGLAAAVLVALSVTITRRLMNPAPVSVVIATLDQGNSTSRRLVLPEGAGAAPEARFVQLAALAEKLWQQPENRNERGDRGYALFDPASREGFIGIQQAPPLRPGQQYRLWVVDERSGEARDAGVLPMREASRGLYFFSLPQADAVMGKLSFMVTVEPEQSAPAEPTGKVVLGRGRF